jgi:hypothetical protein
MKIIENISREIVDCYKNGQSERRVFLQTVKSLLLNRQKEKMDDLSEQEEIAVLQSELKKLQEAMSQYKSGNREDLVKKTVGEIEILKEYLPKEMDESEVRSAIDRLVASEEDKSFGNIMKAAMAELRGRADGSRVAAIVRELTQK